MTRSRRARRPPAGFNQIVFEPQHIQAGAESRLAAARADADRMLAEARERAHGVIETAGREMAAARSARIGQARAEVGAIAERGRQELETLEHSESARLLEELLACVTRTVRELTGSVDEAAVRYLVSRELPARQRG